MSPMLGASPRLLQMQEPSHKPSQKPSQDAVAQVLELLGNLSRSSVEVIGYLRVRVCRCSQTAAHKPDAIDMSTRASEPGQNSIGETRSPSHPLKRGPCDPRSPHSHCPAALRHWY